MHCYFFDGSNDFQSQNKAYNGKYTVSASGLRSVTISHDVPGNESVVCLCSASFTAYWGFDSYNCSAPQYESQQPFDGNCVSYAIEGISRLSSGSVLPKRDDGSVLNRLTDLYPGMVIAGLTKALETENIEMKPIGKYDCCLPEFYKFAIVCDPYRYYHVIRQSTYGAWSHYLISEGVQYYDYEGSFISRPDEVRIMHPSSNVSGDETHFDASSFVGYFSVRSTTND